MADPKPTRLNNLTVHLPESVIGGDPLAYAKMCVRFMHEGSMRGYGVSWFTKEGSHRFTRQFLKGYAMSPSPFAMAEIVAEAMAGWHDAHEALGELISEFHARGQELPPQLASYDIHVWGQRLSKLKRGRRKSDNITRNLAFALIIDALCRYFGLDPTKRRQSKRPAKRPSASGVLTEALKAELPVALFRPPTRTIESAWENFGERLVALNAKSHPPICLPVPSFAP